MNASSEIYDTIIKSGVLIHYLLIASDSNRYFTYYLIDCCLIKELVDNPQTSLYYSTVKAVSVQLWYKI